MLSGTQRVVSKEVPYSKSNSRFHGHKQQVLSFESSHVELDEP